MNRVSLSPDPPARTLPRRDALKLGLAAIATGAGAHAFRGFPFPAEAPDEELVPFLDMPRTPANRLDWETLDSWLTPSDQVFNVQHYGIPEVDPAAFRLELTGMVNKPLSLSMDDIRARPRVDQFMTLECSGNGASKGFMNAVYNSRWTGTPLAPLLRECGIQDGAREIVFFGADTQEETLRPGTPRELKVEVPFGRSLSVDEVFSENPILAYERNGEPIEVRNGAPLRLIVPGWYGIANVKWLSRIDVRKTRYMGRYMARDYVTVRGERSGDDVTFVESSVGRMNLKSIVARVTRRTPANGQVPLRVYGAAWGDGTPIERVEVRLNDGPWTPATLDAEPRKRFCWVFFSLDLGTVPAGRHRIVSRAIDAKGRVQPATEDDAIALKKTYWEANQQWPREIEIEIAGA